jgi:hypothetical protein
LGVRSDIFVNTLFDDFINTGIFTQKKQKQVVYIN